MKRIFLLIGLLSAAASAQDVNTTVRITNSYQTGVGEVSRTGLPMRIPDSISRFDYKFEYSVFDTPYQSAYEFRPYTVAVTPDSSVTEDKTLWVKAGAGYPLMPELRAVWTPVRKEKLVVNFRQDFRGYYGKYRTVRKGVESSPLFTTAGVRYDGYDFGENFGTDLMWKIKRSSFKFGADYDGIFTKDEYLRSNYNGVRANLAFKTAEDASFGFALKVDGGLSVDSWPDAGGEFIGYKPFNERFVGAEGYAVPKISRLFSFRVGYDFRYVDYSGNGDSYPQSYYMADLSPSLHWEKDAFALTAGVNLGYAGSGLKISPLVDFSLSLLKSRMELYATSKGGYKANTMSSLKRVNHWYNVTYNPLEMKPTYDFLDAKAGVRGCIARRLQYDLNAGYAISSDKALYTFGVTGNSSYATIYPSLGFGDYRVFSANALLAWRSERVDVDGNITFRKTNLAGESAFLDAPALSGNGRVMYNWKRRIYAGVRVEASTARKVKISGQSMFIPQWTDLGLYGEYKFTRNLSVWIQASNLLNHPIQKLPMHVEQGIGAVAGICLDLK